MQRIGNEERRARLARRHCLAAASRAATPLEAANALVALHSTDPATVFLSTRARVRDFEVRQLEAALYEDRTLVRMLAMRRTLWVVPRELAAVVHAAATQAVAERERQRLEGFVAQSELTEDPAQWLEELSALALRAVEARGEAFTSDVTRAEPRLATKILLGAGTRWEIAPSAASRILPLLAAEGMLARGRPRTTWTNGQYRWVPMRAWLRSELERLDPAVARAELLRRWLYAFGPATETDIRWWTGWTARDTRAALGAVPHAVVELDDGAGLALADDLEPTEPPERWAALLPTLDPTTMGWKEREWYLGPHASVLFDTNGNAGPTVWWDGQVVGGWSQRSSGEIVFELLEDVGRDAVAAIEAEAARLQQWLGDVRFSPSFLPPFQRALAS
ncbi:MAG TPA: winged helix DNA-binding domain-containing protein [Gaiella sp.]|nr:winged helix DNA-binding domain-containing protein [Gaiella sp.]